MCVLWKVSVIRAPTQRNSEHPLYHISKLWLFYISISESAFKFKTKFSLGGKAIFPYFIWREHFIAKYFIFEFKFRMYKIVQYNVLYCGEGNNWERN